MRKLFRTPGTKTSEEIKKQNALRDDLKKTFRDIQAQFLNLREYIYWYNYDVRQFPEEGVTKFYEDMENKLTAIKERKENPVEARNDAEEFVYELKSQMKMLLEPPRGFERQKDIYDSLYKCTGLSNRIRLKMDPLGRASQFPY